MTDDATERYEDVTNATDPEERRQALRGFYRAVNGSGSGYNRDMFARFIQFRMDELGACFTEYKLKEWARRFTKGLGVFHYMDRDNVRLLAAIMAESTDGPRWYR